MCSPLIGDAEYANADGTLLPVAVADVRAIGEVPLRKVDAHPLHREKFQRVSAQHSGRRGFGVLSPTCRWATDRDC